jgi:hypothetical protein
LAGIQHVIGSAAQPQSDGCKIIAHVCNDAGVWEWLGFARTLVRSWPQARVAYKTWYRVLGSRLALGTTQIVEVEDADVIIANMIARRGVKVLPVQPAPIDRKALERCLGTVANRAVYFEASVHLPLLGGWRKIAPVIGRTLVAAGVPVMVYKPG